MVTISTAYPDLTCNFPNEIDPNRNFSDVTIDAIPLVEKYYQYFDSGDFINATKILNDNPTLKNMIINAKAVQYLYDMCIASQRFYLNDVQRYLVEIVKYKDEWSNTAKYTKYNVVTYIQNGGRESFIAIRNDIPIGTMPTNMDYFVPLTMRGEKGVSGAGLSPRGHWSIETNYYVDDLIVYKNRWYYAKRNNSQSIPKLISDDWEMILEVTQQIKTSETQPTDQSFGDVWLKKLSGSTTGEYDIALNQVDVEGNYVYLYPKTRAGLVSLSNGKTAQEFCDTMNNSLGKASGIATTNASNKVIQTAVKADLSALATALQTTRTINGVNFNGTGNVTSGYVYPVELGANTNFNNVTQSGFYFCPANATVATMSNRPTVNAFSMIVSKHAGTQQLVIEYMEAGYKIYIRNFYSSWGSWQRVYTTVDPPTSVSGNSGTATKLATPRAINGVNFDGSAAINITANPNAHNQGAATITGGTLNGVVLAQTNTSYTTRQLRNVIESTAAPSGGATGDIWLQYK